MGEQLLPAHFLPGWPCY